MIILLDIDGVMITTPAWKPVAIHKDGFLEFDQRAVRNLQTILAETKAGIILTTTHRVNYSLEEWAAILTVRGIYPASIGINERDRLPPATSRATEIREWVGAQADEVHYVVIDDDASMHRLPQNIKDKSVITLPMLGLDDAATQKMLRILTGVKP